MRKEGDHKKYALTRMGRAVERLSRYVLDPSAGPFTDTFTMRLWVRAWGQAAGLDGYGPQVGAIIGKIDNELLRGAQGEV